MVEIFWTLTVVICIIVGIVSISDLRSRVSELESIVRLMEKQKNDYFKGLQNEKYKNPEE